MEIRTLKGPEEIIPAIPHIARLRLTVFHEWPYLYDGTMEEEEVYLKHFAQSEFACVGLAEHEGEVVGATTAVLVAKASTRGRPNVPKPQ